MLNIDPERYRVIDLSYEVVPGELQDRPFDMSLGRLADNTLRYDITKTHSHVGTHVETPWHFYQTGKTISDFPLSAFMGRAVFLPFCLPPGKLDLSPDYLEAELGQRLAPGDIAIFHNAHNKNIQQGHFFGTDAVPHMTVESAQWLRDHGIKLFGFDMLRLGRTIDETRDVHDVLMSNDVCFVEWLDHLEQIDVREFYFMALPYLVHHIDSSFARAIAIVERR